MVTFTSESTHFNTSYLTHTVPHSCDDLPTGILTPSCTKVYKPEEDGAKPSNQEGLRPLLTDRIRNPACTVHLVHLSCDHPLSPFDVSIQQLHGGFLRRRNCRTCNKTCRRPAFPSRAVPQELDGLAAKLVWTPGDHTLSLESRD